MTAGYSGFRLRNNYVRGTRPAGAMPSESKSLGSTLHSSSQLDELDTLSICLPSSASTIGSKIRTKLRGAAHWANDFDVVSVLGGEGQEGRGSGLGTYGQYVHCLCFLQLQMIDAD